MFLLGSDKTYRYYDYCTNIQIGPKKKSRTTKVIKVSLARNVIKMTVTGLL